MTKAPTPPSNGTSLSVHLEIRNDKFVARIDSPSNPEGAEYAFYLRKNGEKIETRWYSREQTATFDAPALPGNYSVTGFSRGRQGRSPSSAPSNKLVVDSPPRQSPSDLGTLSNPTKSPIPRTVWTGTLEALAANLRPSEAQRFDVKRGTLTYSCFKSKKKGDALFVIFGGAVADRSTITLPRFNRFTWTDDFPGTLLCIADPSLSLDGGIRLGWYFGSAQEDAMEGIERIVSTVAEKLAVGLDNVYAYGSSGGGFAALQLVARLGHGATAIAINAQTEAMEYSVQASVDKFLAVCAGGLSASAARSRYPVRLSAFEAWRTSSAQTARCLLVQNTRDHHHHDCHFQPFLRAFDVPVDGINADGRIGSMLYRHADGHAAEPRSMLPAILERVQDLRRTTR